MAGESKSPSPQQQQQEETLLQELKAKNVAFKVYRHEPLMTVEELLKNMSLSPASVCKNIFLKDKKGALYLLTAIHDSPTPLKGLNAKLQASNLRMADEKLLVEKLKVLPGCVTPFAILNDETKEVKLLLDTRIQESDAVVLVHPMHNLATLEIKASDLLQFLESKGIEVKFIDCKELVELATGGTSQSSGAPQKGPASSKSSAPKSESDSCMLGITVKKSENFAEWFTQAIVRGELVEYYDISGCYVIRPWAYRIWETLQRSFDDGIKELGVENCYFPMFVSKAKLEREKDHVEGFSPEVAWVTHYGDSELPEKIAIRPTSETIMYPAFAKWIRSHRDLPLKLNQWCNVVRWEFKQPTPFLRTREFLWQEGHTAHATEEEAYKLVLDILELYRKWYEEFLAVPVIKGEKSEHEKFAGGKKTTTVEGFIPGTGRGIQGATSHLLGQNFSKMFEIAFEDENGAKQLVHQTSWGCTTRSLGVMIMTHGDDKGLVLPPKVAGLQVVIVPILFKEESSEEILSQCRAIQKALQDAGVRVKVDDRTNYTPGWKFNHWELKGVPLRAEIGPKDMQKQQMRVVRRDTGAACNVPWEECKKSVHALLDQIQKDLFTRAQEALNASIEKVTSFDEVMGVLNRKHLVLAPWCEDPETEVEIKKETQRLSELHAKDNPDGMTGAMKTLCIPFEQPPLPADAKCFWSGRPAKRWCLFGRSY